MDINKKIIYLISTSLVACAGSPVGVDKTIFQTPPEIKTTAFSQAINNLGLMYKIYGKKELRIMPTNILDKTGTSVPTKGEIPRDVTDMMKSSLNNIGGGVFFIPYNPQFMLNMANLGYNDWGEKLLPYVVVDGGISEFDRSLIARGEGTDIDAMSSLGSSPFGFDFGNDSKSSLSRVTVDFNLIDFKKNMGIPYMSASNLIELHKSLGERSLGATVYGISLGLKGTIKKIQGRHAAIRLLIQLSVIQLIGKYKNLPYWRLLPNGLEDFRVYELIEDKFNKLPLKQQTQKIQEFLYLNGYSVNLTGVLDSQTTQALTDFQKKKGLKLSANITAETFIPLYYSVPITKESKQKRVEVDRLLNSNNPYILATNDYSNNSSQNASRSISIDDQSRSLEIKPQSEVIQENRLPPLGTISLSAEKTHYKIGEKIRISFSIDKPMFVTIVAINTNGQKATLFPNPYQPEGYVKPFKNHQIPPKNTNGSITISGPAGTDKIYAFASHQQISPSQLKVVDNKIDEKHLESLFETNQSQTEKYVKSVLNIDVE